MTNRLHDETSPYLLQHADNPVHWQPWDDAALAEARETGKPILLSIGYSACHWCHVMAHESFEDPATAEVMNALYVNIKVDREERPDIDRIYQLAQQMFTGRPGGWPLTMFLTPEDHLPIFAGTYFPKRTSYGMPAFADVLTRVESYYRTHRDEIRENGERVLERFARLAEPPADSTFVPSAEPIARARRRLGESYDAANGGFGDAPKFPHPSFVDLLLEGWQHGKARGEADTAAATMVTGTLDAMAAGGLYDHIGGGFFRYCVDGHWGIPHFEKMLYDNAALLATYADAWAATGESDYARVATETAAWLRREMRAPAGAYYATLDADAAGEEGSYYVLRSADLDALDKDDAAFARRLLGLDGPPNFEGHAWHPQTRSREVYRQMDAADKDRLSRIRSRLLDLRETRPRPGRDEKILTAWNGLMIAALARSARRLGDPTLRDEARAAARFVREHLWRDSRLLAVWKDDAARFPAYLDDYAFMLGGLIELLQTDFDGSELRFAIELADRALELFADSDGGFYFTAHDHEKLIHRPKPFADEAVPSGNGVLAVALTVLGHLLGEPRYLDAAMDSIRAAWSSIERFPESHASYLRALRLVAEPPTLVIVRGDGDSLDAWRALLDRDYAPEQFAFLIDAADTGLPGTLAARPAMDSTVAYVCVGTECSAPIATLAGLADALGREVPPPADTP